MVLKSIPLTLCVKKKRNKQMRCVKQKRSSLSRLPHRLQKPRGRQRRGGTRPRARQRKKRTRSMPKWATAREGRIGSEQLSLVLLLPVLQGPTQISKLQAISLLILFPWSHFNFLYEIIYYKRIIGRLTYFHLFSFVCTFKCERFLIWTILGLAIPFTSDSVDVCKIRNI